MAKTYAIGDIHGALLALEQLILRVGPEPGDRFIFLGDYVDGWSQSSHVLEYLMQLGRQHDCIFIKGNHDSWLEEWLEGYFPESDWLIHGGKATIASYEGMSAEDRQRHLAFLRDMAP